MISLLLETGLVSAIFWAAVAAVAVTTLRRLWPVLKLGSPETPTTPAVEFLGAPLFVAVLAVGVFLNLGLAAYKGFAAPHDILVDIVTAREYLAGRSPQPMDLTERITDAVHKEPPPFSLLSWSPELLRRETEEREAGIHRHWVPVHPPFLTLAYVPLAAVLGIYATWAVVAGLSLAAGIVSLGLVVRGLRLKLTFWQAASLALVVLGSAPSLSVLRLGQPSWILTAMLLGCWYCLLPRTSPTQTVIAGAVAGVLAATAAMLKLFPGLLSVYLLLRFVVTLREGLRWGNLVPVLTAAVTALVLVVFVGVFCGWDSYLTQIEIGKVVVGYYAGYSGNLSLIAPVARAEVWCENRQLTLFPWYENPRDGIRQLSAVVGIVGLAAACLVVFRRRIADEARRTTLECGFFLTLMCLLSPVAWDHYLVLLLLPMTVLGAKALSPPASTATAMGFLAVVVVLAAPYSTLEWLDHAAEPLMGGLLGNLLILSSRTWVMLGLAAWLARTLWRGEPSPRVN